MKNLSQLKKEIGEKAADNPEKFFATDILRQRGFNRNTCIKCGMKFWSTVEREVCGEPECGDGYTFINDSPTDQKYTHKESWDLFNHFMQSRGYKSINRYPTVARWRSDVEFTGASIYCFQPYVVSGEAEPPAKELVIPQPSLRFNDIDNVGITGRHYTNFTMIGQTCFQPPDEYDQDRYFKDMLDFTVKQLGIPEEKLVLHEDSWGGGGNLGACMEFFVDGLELFNQVYMFYERTPEGYEELDLKVLDMGMGHERITWISNGTETSYESVMPKTLSKMKEKTGLQVNQDTWEEFLPYSSELNVDEVDDIDQKWDEVASKMRMDTDTLKEDIKPSAALYSVAEHTRALMFALADGKIPSNTGGGHNLRMIYRRAQDFIQKYNWNIQITQVAEWHAEELKPLFPELKESLDEIKEILRVEHQKYEKSREKAQEKLSKLDSQPSIEEMIELYESHGVSPEMMEENGFKVTEDFYTNLNTNNNQLNQADKSFNIKQDTKTEKLYYKNREPYRLNNKPEPQDFTFEADVIEKVNDEWIVLDRTMFYPEGGGQAADTGNIADNTVKAVEKQDGIVLHHAPENNLQTGDSVKCKVNGERRKQLTQHHSTTHMVNAATREILGNHIYQAGANKTTEKARLDITHYEKPSNQKIRQIESHVQQIIEENHGIQVMEKKKSKAEQQHGFKIYQGGAPPGNKIRLVDIEQVDIEACGGTHLTKSSHAEEFVVTGCKRIQDGVIRLEYKAGKAARDFQQDIGRIFGEVVSKLFKDDETSLLNLDKSEANRDITEIKPERTLNLEEKREILEKMSEKFSVEIVDLPKTIQKFLDERKRAIARSEEIERKTGITPSSDFSRSSVFARARNLLDEHKVYTAILETSTSLFEEKKELKKNVDKQESKIEEYVEKNIKESEGGMELEIPTKNVGLLIQVAQKLSSKHQTTITLVGEEGAISASETNESAKKKLEELGSENVQGNDSFAKAFDI